MDSQFDVDDFAASDHDDHKEVYDELPKHALHRRLEAGLESTIRYRLEAHGGFSYRLCSASSLISGSTEGIGY